jgi:RNA polymerase primary sigma factor
LVDGCGEFVSLQPEVLSLSPEEVAWLDTADQHLLEKLLRDPFEYMDHASLHECKAEETLFGGIARLGHNSTYFQETQASGPGSVPQGGRLDHAGERLGFQRYNYARMRVSKTLLRYRHSHLPRRAIREMLAWMHRALMIRGWLAQANIALVLAMTQRSRFGGLDRNEVLSAGNYALLRSIDRFDWSRGFKFSTYACQGIMQRIMHVVEATRRYRSRFISDYDETLELDDAAGRRHEIQEQSCVEDLRDILSRNRAHLTDVEQAVLTHRFGLQDASNASDEERGMTLQEIGDVVGVTKERIRQIQMRALRKLRVLMEREYLAA